VLQLNNGLVTFIETLKARDLFDRGSSVIATRAPGRLDVMGGIADYSGSLVLQRPIAEATFAAIQVIERPVIEIMSLGRKPYTMPLSSIIRSGEPVSYSDARKLFGVSEEHHWAAYVIGVFMVLMRECGVSFSRGSRIVISSSVPEGKGVSSSAALETATMQAVVSAFEIQLEPQTMAVLCQKAENLVAGAPCGVMDQMTCMCGEEDALLALVCRPAELQPAVRIPEDIVFWGLDSGERHTVSGSDYGSVRTGAFMGYRMIAESDTQWNGYLANISPAEFEREYVQRLPDEISGEEFLNRYSGTTDTVTTVNAGRRYKVRQPAAHPVYEHHRVKMFRQLLLAPPSEERRRLLGELMYQSHSSYSACGLGSSGTDLIVSLVRAAGPANGLYGARITGGGSGGTVAVLGGRGGRGGRGDGQQAITRVVDTYESITRYRPYVFQGSSSGVARFGSHHMIL
jgi:galactokinase